MISYLHHVLYYSFRLLYSVSPDTFHSHLSFKRMEGIFQFKYHPLCRKGNSWSPYRSHVSTTPCPPRESEKKKFTPRSPCSKPIASCSLTCVQCISMFKYAIFVGKIGLKKVSKIKEIWTNYKRFVAHAYSLYSTLHMVITKIISWSKHITTSLWGLSLFYQSLQNLFLRKNKPWKALLMKK